MSVIGSWTLRSFTAHVPDGPPSHPLGPDAQGALLYAASGHMMACLYRAGRAQLGVGRLEARARASDTDKAAAFDTYVSYGGTWTLVGDQMTHHVQHALTPDQVGRDNVRTVQLSGDVLTLSYQVTPRRGPARRYALIWDRDV